MNIKLHTPKSLKAGSGMATTKQFMLSLLATTVSIILTFGTAAVVDHSKKQKEKREIVMMVMCDLYNSLKSMEKTDSMLHMSMDIQRQIAEDPSLFDTLRFHLAHLLPTAEFTETTERIFSSSIETISTVSNVLFTEKVAEFYLNRQLYKSNICDSVFNSFTKDSPFSTLKGLVDFDYFSYAWASNEFLFSMRDDFAQCKQIMAVTDEEINAYWEEKKMMEASMPDRTEAKDSVRNELYQLSEQIDQAKEKLKLE